MWHWAAIILTFPEGLIWPGLRNGWYAVVCALWFPIGLTWMLANVYDYYRYERV